VIKHAHATQVTVVLKREPGRIIISILDNGRGFAPDHRQVERNGHRATLGLASMAERARLLDGQIEIQSAEGTGTRVTLTMPLLPGPELK
jgi:signal transduction histidine kinase